MADKKNRKNNNRNNMDDDFNPKFRKVRKKFAYFAVTKTLN